MVREICRRAARRPAARASSSRAGARVRVLDVRTLLDRLFRAGWTLLTGGPRDLPARQQTLSETIAWSANLLSASASSEVFAAPLRLPRRREPRGRRGGGAAPTSTCWRRWSTTTSSVATTQSGEPRFSQARDDPRVRGAGCSRARRPPSARFGDDLRTGVSRSRSEPRPSSAATRRRTGSHASTTSTITWRAGLAELHEREGSEELLRLAVPLFRFWYVRGYLTEGRRWLGLALAGAEQASAYAPPPGVSPRPVRSRSCRATTTPRRRSQNSALEVARELDDRRLVANALSNLGAIALAAGDEAHAEDELAGAVELAREVGDERILALALNNLGDVALTTADYERAEPLFAESLSLLGAPGATPRTSRGRSSTSARWQLMRGRHAEAPRALRPEPPPEPRRRRQGGPRVVPRRIAGLAAATSDGERAGLLVRAARRGPGRDGRRAQAVRATPPRDDRPACLGPLRRGGLRGCGRARRDADARRSGRCRRARSPAT